MVASSISSVLHSDQGNSPVVDRADAFLEAPEIITKNGFPLEIHYVTTADGYILTDHRLPRPGSFPIFLSHGILCSSRDWLMQRGKNGLAYQLYNAGYDVWLGNTRGNTYSTRHVNLTTDDVAYWDFAVDQVSVYDVPAQIDYVLRKTRHAQLGWIGYSLGTTTLLAGLISKPEYQRKVRVFVGLAPVTETTNCGSELGRILAGLTLPEEPLKSALTAVNRGKFIPSMLEDVVRKFLPAICAPEVDRPEFCGNSLALLAGFNPKQIDDDMQVVIHGGWPSSISVKMLVQQLQGVVSGAGKFRPYNYQDTCLNRRAYGLNEPPEFNLKNFKVPTIIFAGRNDYLAAPEDVELMAQKLPNVKYYHNISDPSWSHLDFIFAKEAKGLVYDVLITHLKEFAPAFWSREESSAPATSVT